MLMVEGRQCDAWNHTASLLSLLHNVNCPDKSKMKPPAFFNPFTPRAKAPALGVEDLKVAFQKNFPTQ
jgi:hypothetical protein